MAVNNSSKHSVASCFPVLQSYSLWAGKAKCTHAEKYTTQTRFLQTLQILSCLMTRQPINLSLNQLIHMTDSITMLSGQMRNIFNYTISKYTESDIPLGLDEEFTFIKCIQHVYIHEYLCLSHVDIFEFMYTGVYVCTHLYSL